MFAILTVAQHMQTNSLNVGCGLIATAPGLAAHFCFAHEIRYILLAWFCSFVSTVLLVFCSLSCLFTQNPWFILLYSIPFDVIGKAVLKFFACRFHFLRTPRSRMSLGMAMGLGFALAHVLTIYLPMCFDQPYSVDFDEKHPDYFPNSLDLAFLNNYMTVFQMAIGLIWFRFAKFCIYLMTLIMLLGQFAFSAMSMIPIIAVKQIAMFVVSYGLFVFAIFSFRSLELEPDEIAMKDHNE